jgi:hypothetical protein
MGFHFQQWEEMDVDFFFFLFRFPFLSGNLLVFIEIIIRESDENRSRKKKKSVKTGFFCSPEEPEICIFLTHQLFSTIIFKIFIETSQLAQ